MSRTAHWILFAAPLAGLMSCGTPFPQYEPADAGREWHGHFPDHREGTRMTMRAILAFRGMELPWTLRVLRRMPGDLRLLALDDLGSSPLHVVVKDGTTTIVSQSELLPEGFVREGLCRDLSAWLFAAQRSEDRLVLRGDGKPALVRTEPAGRTMYWASGEGSTSAGSTAKPPVDRIATEAGGSLQAEIELQWEVRTEGAAPECTGARIVNHRIGYSMDIEIRESRTAELTDTHFRTEQ